jgi:hypothetical protein
VSGLAAVLGRAASDRPSDFVDPVVVRGDVHDVAPGGVRLDLAEPVRDLIKRVRDDHDLAVGDADELVDVPRIGLLTIPSNLPGQALVGRQDRAVIGHDPVSQSRADGISRYLTARPFEVQGQKGGEQIVARQVGRPAVGGGCRLVESMVGSCAKTPDPFTLR